ncbi:MAG: hypothetical protein GWO08_06350, partial [Gammaproteobacteria bacterium]|nr:hypothetical protein [candidate division Zixibacteria bacterium]NIR93295.1 hypothetical protein [Gammaproteobacteria bacterium]NIR66946.1 hypothetical protein [candidate division Zixibacteria bacterium]NIS48405.1 hypothetical protein [candidate division Zixibacteria bacterium]NIU16523.1 hypothetical protein [candidate division Zixibacteria bacterium]
MRELDSFFRSPQALHQKFRQGLWRLLEQDSLGSFILVLANALQDGDVWQAMQQALHSRLLELEQHIEGTTDSGFNPDDLTVFFRILAMGFSSLEPVQIHRAGPWEIQQNELRGLRPARMSQQSPTQLYQEFNP